MCESHSILDEVTKDLMLVSLLIEYGSYSLFQDTHLTFEFFNIEDKIFSGSPANILSLPLCFCIESYKLIKDFSNHHLDVDPIL
mgnify:CR=1 FL=1